MSRNKISLAILVSIVCSLCGLAFAGSAVAAGDAWVNKEGKLIYKGGKTANQITLKFDDKNDYPWVVTDATGKVTARNLKGESKCKQVNNSTRCKGVGARTSIIYLEEGDDKADIQAPADVRASLGNDVITIKDAKVVVDGFKGDDRVSASGGNVRIDGGLGNDNLSAAGGDSVLIGNVGDDVLAADGGRAVVRGGEGNDMLYGKSDKYSVKVYGSTGADTIGVNGEKAYGYGQGDNDTIGVGGGAYGNGDVGSDALNGTGRLVAGADNDSITSRGQSKVWGDEGNDTVNHEWGPGTIYGGDGDDRIYAGGRSFVGGGKGYDVIRGQKSSGDEVSPVEFQGGPDSDWLLGSSAGDKLEGGGGYDTIIGLGGVDRINGDGNPDIVVVSGYGQDRVSCDSEDTIVGSKNDLLIGCRVTASIEKAVCDGVNWSGFNSAANRQLLSSGVDFARSWGGNDNIDGYEGDDCIWGDSGNDLLFGRDGDDIVFGGVGSDVIQAGSGIDQIFGDGPGSARTGGNTLLAVDVGEAKKYPDYVQCSGSDVTVVDEFDRVSGCRPTRVPENTCVYWGGKNRTGAAVSITGDNRPEVFKGWKGNDRIDAREGHDCVFSGTGRDKVYGGRGNDRLYPGPGADKIKGGPGFDKIYARDGKRDVIRCGADRDRVAADRKDKVSRDCEAVSRRR